jgi:hypothetical protein
MGDYLISVSVLEYICNGVRIRYPFRLVALTHPLQSSELYKETPQTRNRQKRKEGHRTADAIISHKLFRLPLISITSPLSH